MDASNIGRSSGGNSPPRVSTSSGISERRIREELDKDHKEVSPQKTPPEEIYLGLPVSDFIQAVLKDGRENLADDFQRRVGGSDGHHVIPHGGLATVLNPVEELDLLRMRQGAWLREKIALTREIDRLRRNQRVTVAMVAGQNVDKCTLTLSQPGSSNSVGIDLNLPLSMPLTIQGDTESFTPGEASGAEPK